MDITVINLHYRVIVTVDKIIYIKKSMYYLAHRTLYKENYTDVSKNKNGEKRGISYFKKKHFQSVCQIYFASGGD